MLKKTTPLVLALALSGAGLPGAPMPEPIAYPLRFPAPQTHYVEDEARVPTDGRPEVELMMAVWTPGSYLVREYARAVEGGGAAPEGGGRPPARGEGGCRSRRRSRTAGGSGRGRPRGSSSDTGSTRGRCRCGPTSSI